MGTYKDLNDYEIMYMVEENDDAKELLFEKYRPIVISMANKYYSEAKRIGLDLDDLIQEGYLGLYSAIRNYNSDSDTLFYTYALVSIRSKILNCLSFNGSLKNYNLNNGISLSKTFSDDGVSLIDYIIDKNQLSPQVIVEHQELIYLVFKFLYDLDINLASVFELSINGFNIDDISNLLCFSKKTVSNKLFRARRKLYQHLKLVH